MLLKAQTNEETLRPKYLCHATYCKFKAKFASTTKVACIWEKDKFGNNVSATMHKAAGMSGQHKATWKREGADIRGI